MRTRTFVFLMSGVFIAVGTCLTVYDIGLDPHMDMNVLINAMVAMIIGGRGRFSTCVIGGITLGIFQALTVYQFSSNWQNAITFVLLLVLVPHLSYFGFVDTVGCVHLDDISKI